MKTDAPHILFVNPWIHDFAAFDFWARPMGLLSLAAILREHGVDISFIDCLDRFHPNETQKPKIQWDGRGPYRKTPIDNPKELESINRQFSRYGILPEWFDQDLNAIKKPDLVFVTSMMTYWATGVKETIDRIKAAYPDVPVVLGGVYASLCHDHAVNSSGADLVIKGPGENQLQNILKRFTGYYHELPDNFEDLNKLPYPAFDLMRKISYIPVLTSRGCPFSCEYCASSYLEPTLRRRSWENVFNEIQYWHRQHRVKNFAFYDDALLVDAENHAFPLFRKLSASKMDVWFHTPNALHIRNITQEAAGLMAAAGFKSIRLGLETTQFGSNRQFDVKVAENDFKNAVRYLKAAGFEKKQIGAYLLCGLPEQDLEEVARSIELVKQSGIQPVLAYYTPIPHTPMWENACRHSKYNLEKHPVFTNNTLFPCMRSDRDLKRISQLKNLTR